MISRNSSILTSFVGYLGIMSAQNLKQRHTAGSTSPPQPQTNTIENPPDDYHPAGEVKHGEIVQVIRLLAVLTYFGSCAFTYVYSTVRKPGAFG